MAPTPKYPHSVGPTRLEYSPDGRYLLTTGANALARRFVSGSTREPDTIELDAPGLAVAASSRHFAIAGEDGTVALYALESATPVGMLLRAPLPVRSVAFSGDGSWAAIAGDSGITVVNVEDIATVRRIPQQSRPPRHVSFRPRASNGSVIAVSYLDATLRVYSFDSAFGADVGNLEQPEGQLVFAITDTLPFLGDSADSRSTAASWSPDGALLALPSKTFDIAVFYARDGAPAFRLRGAVDPLTDIAWSPNGVYVAATTRGGALIIWAASTREIVHKEDGMPELGHVRWHPHQNTLAWTSAKGQLYVSAEDALPASLPAPFGDVVELPRSDRKRRALQRELADLRAEARDEEGEDVDDDDDGDDSDIELAASDNGDGDEELSDFLDEQELWGTTGNPSATAGGRPEKQRRKTDGRQGIGAKRTLGVSRAPLRQAFQSGSTPWIDGRRYLCMGAVGSVWSQMQDNEHNSVTINFADTAKYRDVHFRDGDKFELASLSSQGCLFATASAGGRVAMRFHGSQIDNWEWQAPASDSVVAVALTASACNVWTKAGLQLTFSLYGTLVDVSRLARDPVATVGAYESVVATVRHVGAANGRSGLALTLQDISAQTTLLRDFPVDVPANANVKALLFNDSGSPLIVDDTGCLSMLDRWRAGPMHARWIPVYQPQAKTSQWPLAVVDGSYLCIELRSAAERYPPCPLPTPAAHPLSIPGITELESETLLTRAWLMQAHDQFEAANMLETPEARTVFSETALDLDRLLLRQLKQACGSNRHNRALDIASKISTAEAQSAAAEIASMYGQTMLANKIMELFEEPAEVARGEDPE